MRKLTNFIVNKRYLLLALILVAAVVCAFLSASLKTNTDMTKYLPDDSPMRQGMALMAREFPEGEAASIRVVFEGLDEAALPAIQARLEAIEYVSSVTYASDGADKAARFVVNSRYAYGTDEEKAIEAALASDFSEYEMTFQNNDVQTTDLPTLLLVAAVALALLILLVTSETWLEPLLFLVTIGIAVLLNLGTNCVLPYTSDLTGSIGPILQLVLSMDYSIILMNRYRQERAHCDSKTDAMKAALAGALSPIASSAMTTVVGLLALLFLNFKLGAELGIVLAKGVFLSMLCALTVLPVLILLCDKWLARCKKRAPRLPMGGLAKVSFAARRVMPVVLLALFAGFCFLQSKTDIAFTEGGEDALAEVFPKENTVVLLYDNRDEARMQALLEEFADDAQIKGISAYATTLGVPYTAQEMQQVLAASGGLLPAETLQQLYGTRETMTLPEFLDFLCDEILPDERFSGFFDEQTASALRSGREMLTQAAAQLRGETHSRAIFTSTYPEESAETAAFLSRLDAARSKHLTNESYLVGTSAMVHEMEGGWEYAPVTLITAAAVFLVVLLAFRNAVIPALLTLLVQCGVFVTVTIFGAVGGAMYYLALLIVQSILMGATIDYGIVFCSYYRESRRTMGKKAALKAAYDASIRTIMASGAILVLALAVLGFFSTSEIMAQVCLTLSVGSLVAIALILLVLPGTLVCFDRLATKKADRTEE